MQEYAKVNPIEDQRKEALKHYEEASNAIHHWSSFVEHAIKAYNPSPVDVEALKLKYAEHLGLKQIDPRLPNYLQIQELDTSDAYAIEWAANNI